MKHVAEFINELSTNESLKKELGESVAKADTSDGKIKLAVQYARDAGFDVSEEEFATIVEKVNVKTELSDDELDRVAGGYDFGYEAFTLTNYANDNLTTGTDDATQIGNSIVVGAAAAFDLAVLTGPTQAIAGIEAAANYIGDVFSGW